MSFDDLDLTAWRALDPAAVERVAREIAGRVGADLAGIDGHRAYFLLDGCEYALVPGGAVTLGYDGTRFVPEREQVESYYWAEFGEDYDEDEDEDEDEDDEADGPQERNTGWGHEPDPAELGALAAQIPGLVDKHTSTPRSATLPPLLVARQCWSLSLNSHAEAVAHLAERGLRPLTPDEWEHACAAGTSTLWWWGDHWPGEGYPYECPAEKFGKHPFGLTIAQNDYRLERTTDPVITYGGDGGVSACGGEGHFWGWLTVASAARTVHEAVMQWDSSSAVSIQLRPAIQLD